MLPNVMTPVENLKSGVEAEGYIYIYIRVEFY